MCGGQGKGVAYSSGTMQGRCRERRCTRAAAAYLSWPADPPPERPVEAAIVVGLLVAVVASSGVVVAVIMGHWIGRGGGDGGGARAEGHLRLQARSLCGLLAEEGGGR